jgi:hypothetical protein
MKFGEEREGVRKRLSLDTILPEIPKEFAIMERKKRSWN